MDINEQLEAIKQELSSLREFVDETQKAINMDYRNFLIKNNETKDIMAMQNKKLNYISESMEGCFERHLKLKVGEIVQGVVLERFDHEMIAKIIENNLRSIVLDSVKQVCDKVSDSLYDGYYYQD